MQLCDLFAVADFPSFLGQQHAVRPLTLAGGLYGAKYHLHCARVQILSLWAFGHICACAQDVSILSEPDATYFPWEYLPSSFQNL